MINESKDNQEQHNLAYIPINQCKAESPQDCQYHSVYIRMLNVKEELTDNPTDDAVLDAYYQYRQTLDTMEKRGWKETSVVPIEVDNSFSVEQVIKAIEEFGPADWAHALRELEEFSGLVSLTKENTENSLELPEIGRAILIDGFWGREDGPIHIWIVFEIGGRKFRITGEYNSWDASKWNADAVEVSAHRFIKTTIENVYEYVE